MPVPVVEARHVEALERLMDELSEELPYLDNFILPGGSAGAAQLHVARTVCRRAERLAVALARQEPVGPFVVRYLNRLSDALFVMARYENLKRGIPDVLWNSRA
jgi:cob(I)alamin adenosyltransferase